MATYTNSDPHMLETLTSKQVLTVTELNRTVKKLLENHFQIIWVEGEVSNLSKPQSGHYYFSLKDPNAQVRCAMFRIRTLALPFELENGMHILATAKISLYEGRGDYQLIIEHLEERGEGLLRRRFEMLKNKLAEQGFFDATRKRALPKLPKRIGVITSPTGAAIRDVLSVLKRRFASIPVIIYPTQVQGEQAASQIAAAINLANEQCQCDVLIICRGGGSLEDLWAFNEEIVARAIYNSTIPTVSGVGHEIDFTITDFVVDERAATPSAAAELLSPNKHEFYQRIVELIFRIKQCIHHELRHLNTSVCAFQSRVLQPTHLVQKYTQTLDIKEQTITHTMRARLELEKRKLELLATKLNHLSPLQQLKEKKLQFTAKIQLISHLIHKQLNDSKQNLLTLSRTLNTVSPLNTLERGYSITTKNSHVVEDICHVQTGDTIQIQIKNGYLFCVVNDTKRK